MSLLPAWRAWRLRRRQPESYPDDPYRLGRFVAAQAGVHARALAELNTGRKRSHWMWFVFPQLAGLGRSTLARHYALASLEEARAYLAHPLLGSRLIVCAEAMLRHAGSGHGARQILGSPDDLKLRSCATLFARAAPEQTQFQAILDAFYAGQPGPLTLALLGTDSGG